MWSENPTSYSLLPTPTHLLRFLLGTSLGQPDIFTVTFWYFHFHFLFTHLLPFLLGTSLGHPDIFTFTFFSRWSGQMCSSCSSCSSPPPISLLSPPNRLGDRLRWETPWCLSWLSRCRWWWSDPGEHCWCLLLEFWSGWWSWRIAEPLGTLYVPLSVHNFAQLWPS